MRIVTLLVTLALVGGLGAPERALAQGSGESRCAFCHRPANGPGGPGCPQAVSLHGEGGGGYGGGYDPDAELRGAARELGTALGQALAEELFGGGQAAQQRAYEAAAAAAAAEAAQRALEAARLELSNQLRSDWDARDAEHSRSLASIFDGARRARAPRAAPSPRSSGGRAPPPPPPPVWLDPGVVDLRGTVAGGASLPALEAWSRVDAAPMLRASVGPRFTPSLAPVPPPPPPDGWPGVARARDLLLDEAKGALKDELIDLLPDGPKRALEAHLAAFEGTRVTLELATEGAQALAYGTPAQVEALSGQVDRQLRSTTEEVVDKAAGDDALGGDWLGPARKLLLGD